MERALELARAGWLDPWRYPAAVATVAAADGDQNGTELGHGRCDGKKESIVYDI